MSPFSLEYLFDPLTYLFSPFQTIINWTISSSYTPYLDIAPSGRHLTAGFNRHCFQKCTDAKLANRSDFIDTKTGLKKSHIVNENSAVECVLINRIADIDVGYIRNETDIVISNALKLSSFASRLQFLIIPRYMERLEDI